MNDIIIFQLQKNISVFKKLLQDISDIEICTWKPDKDRWCILEVLCHLYDEEKEDFKFRTKWVLENPGKVPPSTDPEAWVTERKYMEQNYVEMLKKFIAERIDSIMWLKSIENVNWHNAYEHPTLGKLSARSILVNWLAHDYIHMRQIIKLKYDYIKELTGEEFQYAGSW
ncbi:hypothetical protein GTQ40_02250 [Flavobacteriaceae bacterium R38]|nr:hypothetical protein [Flavobacteriaceae bacterium R38]